MSETQDHWDRRYRERDQVFSGRVNTRLAEIAGDLRPGTALDLGCGEGADAVWLATHGWWVVAVDVSTVALRRAARAAEAREVADRIDFQQHDLGRTFPQGSFDLVSAQFLHSTIDLDRRGILRRAAGAVVPGGLLVIVDHGAAPPWADKHAHEHRFPPPEAVMADLDLPEAAWERVRVGQVDRPATGPDGGAATLIDNLIVLHRLP